MSISDYYETQLLKALKNESPAVANVYVKLHLAADPGEAGTTEPAANTVRKAVTWKAPSEGKIKNETKIEWTGAQTKTETIKGLSLWDAEAAGNCLWSGSCTEKAVTEGDTLSIPAEGLTVELA